MAIQIYLLLFFWSLGEWAEELVYRFYQKQQKFFSDFLGYRYFLRGVSLQGNKVSLEYLFCNVPDLQESFFYNIKQSHTLRLRNKRFVFRDLHFSDCLSLSV